jgi:type VI secretion system protein
VRARSLLERLRQPDAGGELRAEERLEDVANSIQQNLQRLLNCRQGSAAAAMDYGLPDITDVGRTYPESLEVLEESLRSTVSKYEPRLRDVEVHAVESNGEILRLNFRITARLAESGEDVGVVFTTSLDSDGHVDVKG